MKTLNTILAAVGALLMLSVTSANSLEFKAGVSANGMAAYANAEERLKGNPQQRITNEEAILATSFASAFVEISSDEAMGLGIGISYAPEVVDLEKETRTIQDATGDSGNASGDQITDGKVNDLVSIYATMPIGEGAYVKAGYMQVDLNTIENLATGGAYGNTSLDGYTLGVGYNHNMDNGAFFRVETNYMEIDGTELTNTNDSTKKVKADGITGASVGLSVGKSF